MAGDERDSVRHAYDWGEKKSHTQKRSKPRVKLLLQNYSQGWGRCRTQDPNCPQMDNKNYQAWPVYRNLQHGKAGQMVVEKTRFAMFLGLLLHAPEQYDIDDFDGRLESSIYAFSLRHSHSFIHTTITNNR